MNWKFWKRKPSCEHKFSSWEITHRFVSMQTGLVKIVQSRNCTLCGFTEINSKETR